MSTYIDEESALEKIYLYKTSNQSTQPSSTLQPQVDSSNDLKDMRQIIFVGQFEPATFGNFNKDILIGVRSSQILRILLRKFAQHQAENILRYRYQGQSYRVSTKWESVCKILTLLSPATDLDQVDKTWL